MSDEPKTYTLTLTEDRAMVLWWALYEKHVELETRVKQFIHMSWPPEAKNAAAWERNTIKEVLNLMQEEHERQSW